jgi:GMP synthase (glutamine-hydrolysing)
MESGNSFPPTRVGRSEGLILELQQSCPLGRLGLWLVANAVPFHVEQVWRTGRISSGVDMARFLVVLGSSHSVNDDSPKWIVRVIEMIGEAVKRGVPVLGICFGSQALAVALGGRVGRLSSPEIACCEVSTSGTLVPRGPWVVWHYDAFAVPPTAETLCWSARGPLAFRLGPHLGVQFHVEATAACVERWIAEERAKLARSKVDAGALREEGRRLGPQSERAAGRLFAEWWTSCVEPSDRIGDLA